MTIPVFPLPVYLLPGGITRLRIFEQRYLHMVKNANQTNGFVISLHRPELPEQVGNWGSWVEIIDFQMGQDNLLIIDVKCKSLVAIYDVQRTDNNLLTAKFSEQEHWPPISATEHTIAFSQHLKRVFEQNKELAALYQGQFIDQPNWVCARWLELFPIGIEDKEYFTRQDSVEDALDFLTAVIIEQRQLDTLIG